MSFRISPQISVTRFKNRMSESSSDDVLVSSVLDVMIKFQLFDMKPGKGSLDYLLVLEDHGKVSDDLRFIDQLEKYFLQRQKIL